MLFFYILITTLLYPLVQIAPFFNEKAKAFLQKRRSDKAKIKALQSPNARVLWLHSASVGELDQCKALARVIKENEPNTLIIQSVFSESVLEKNFDTEYTYLTFRLPLDFYFSYDFIFKKFKPDTLVLMAWDTWTNLILSAKRHNCKVYLSSAVMDPKSRRSSIFVRSLTKKIFGKLNGISPVNEVMIPSFQELCGSQVKIFSCGDSRFDSVVGKIKTKKPNEFFTKFAENYPYKKILILASTYSECERMIFPVLPEILALDYAVWIFPHKIEPLKMAEIASNLRNKNHKLSIYSEIKNSCNDKIVLFDVLGILAFAYNYGKIAYIGGAKHNRIHNVLEPAYFGLPLISGEKIHSSFDALQLQKSNSLLTVNTKEEFKLAFEKLSHDETNKLLSKTNQDYVQSKLGASEKFYELFIKK